MRAYELISIKNLNSLRYEQKGGVLLVVIFYLCTCFGKKPEKNMLQIIQLNTNIINIYNGKEWVADKHNKNKSRLFVYKSLKMGGAQQCKK